MLVIEAFGKKRKYNAYQTYQQALLNGVAFSVYNPMNTKRKHFPKFYEFFPEYKDDYKPKQQDWRIAKANMEKFVKLHNKEVR